MGSFVEGEGADIDPRLATLIDNYQRAVAKAIALLSTYGIPRPATNTAWVMFDMPDLAILPDGVRLMKHGYGCRVKADGIHVDFDFGQDGQIDGFDCYRLYDFTRGKMLTRYGIDSETSLKDLFDSACVAKELIFSGYILWYLSDTNTSPPQNS